MKLMLRVKAINQAKLKPTIATGHRHKGGKKGVRGGQGINKTYEFVEHEGVVFAEAERGREEGRAEGAAVGLQVLHAHEQQRQVRPLQQPARRAVARQGLLRLVLQRVSVTAAHQGQVREPPPATPPSAKPQTPPTAAPAAAAAPSHPSSTTPSAAPPCPPWLKLGCLVEVLLRHVRFAHQQIVAAHREPRHGLVRVGLYQLCSLLVWFGEV